MTDNVTTAEVVTSSPSNLPKPTTPDDLLDMYEAEEVTAEPETKASIAPKPVTPIQKQIEAPKEVDSEAPEAPVFKAKLGDQEINVPEEAVFKTEINGKEVEFKAKDAIQAYQKRETFERTMSKRVNDVTYKERALRGEYDGIKAKATSIVNSAMTGDFWSTIDALATIAAGNAPFDKVKFQRAMMDQIESFKDPYTKMNQEQRDQFFERRRAKLLEDENKTLKQDKDKIVQTTALENKITELQQKHGLSQQDFWSTFEFIKSKLVGEGNAFATEHDIEPEHVIQQHYFNGRANVVKQVATKYGLTDPDILNEIVDGAINHPEWTEDSISKIIEKSGVIKTAPKEAVENLNRKVRRNGTSTSSKVSSTKSGKAEGYDGEDLDFLYRNGPKGYTPINRR